MLYFKGCPMCGGVVEVEGKEAAQQARCQGCAFTTAVPAGMGARETVDYVMSIERQPDAPAADASGSSAAPRSRRP